MARPTKVKADAVAARMKATEDLLPSQLDQRKALAEAFHRGQDSVCTRLEGLILGSSDDGDQFGIQIAGEIGALRKHLDDTA